jgi:hypothetical protein
MKGFQRLSRSVLVATLIATMMPVPVRGAVSCHKINAKGVGQDLGGGTTQAQILGGGLLHGTTTGIFVITGISGTLASFTGTITFTTNHGTVIAAVDGTFDVASGEFTAAGPVSSGTGKLAGATGTVDVHGLQDPTGSFVEDVTGEICVDLSPDGL